MFPPIDFNQNSHVTFAHCPPGADGLALAHYFKKTARNFLYVVADDFLLDQAAASIRFFAPDLPLIVLPAWDCLPYDRISPSSDVMAQRLSALARILSPNEKVFVLASVAAVTQKLMPPDIISKQHQDFVAGKSLNIDQLTAYLNLNGYQRVGTVREVGDYAIRGHLIDLFPPQSENPIRIDLFGDNVESVHYFDPVTQRKNGSPITRKIELCPAQEILLDQSSISRFRSFYRESFGADAMNDAIYESVTAGRRHAGMEHFLPFFYGELSTIFDYMPDAVIIEGAGIDLAFTARQQEVDDYYNARVEFLGSKAAKDLGSYRPVPKEQLYFSSDIWKEIVTGKNRIKISPSTPPGHEISIDIGAKPLARLIESKAYAKLGMSEKLFEEFKNFIHQLNLDKKLAGIACYSDGSLDRIKKLLKDFGIESHQVDSYQDFIESSGNRVFTFVLPIEHGFSTSDYAIVSEQDLLGDRLSRTAKKERKAEDVLFEASSLNAGDYVVHIDHGVGRFLGLEKIQAAGADHDCLCLEYSGGDKLYVPVENIELLSRYGASDSIVSLDKLGGIGWQSRKARVKERIREIAEQLIRLAAVRQTKQGDVFEKPESYHRFCSAFPYVETGDQMRAIDDTIRDLSIGRPMDRLVCGDVGFGKTEVALRAAFIAASHGAQVAVVTPTTLLARQHFHNFSRRFQGFGINIAQLSRMVSSVDAAKTKADLADGRVGIAVGTHALLSKNIQFANLGLVIVDEEQHFGVAQKERLKELQSNVHVLTLSATPIPRTLQMSLTGVRDLSIIATPPVDRHAVQTHVMPYDPMIIREAILRERHRGGQSFYVCPRIEDLTEISTQLRQLIPDIRLAVAHGQLPPTSLEQIMTDFVDQKYDILVSTNIIESGLDIPSANTIIIHRSDMFGLAQLYQLRGRVGRTKIRAYAYLTIPERRVPTEIAQKRLQVMQTLDHLGAGFSVASHDMDIRGAGNLLGEEQSGHVREVGIELYQHLLQEAVMAARDGASANKTSGGITAAFSPQINLGIPVLIPEDYIQDLGTRMNFYRRISNLKQDQELESLAAEMVDRFGPLPQPVENLLTVVSIKNMCLRVGIEKIDAGPKGAVISFYQNKFTNPESLIRYIQSQSGTVKIRPDQKLVLMRGWGDSQAKIQGVKTFMNDIEKLAA